MFIEFVYVKKEPHTNYWLLEKTQQHLSEWSRQYQITYTTKVIKNRLRVCFTEDKYYDFFVMTFDRAIFDYHGISMKLIVDPNNRG